MLRTKSNIVISKSKKNTHHPQYNFDVDDKKKLYRADIYNPKFNSGLSNMSFEEFPSDHVTAKLTNKHHAN